MGYKVLVVDDDAGVRRPLGAFLARSGFDVCEAESASSGVQTFLREHPDVVVLDHALPDGNSLDLLPRFKSDRPEVPVFVLTGYGSIDLAVDAVKLGAENFLTKPVEPATLARLLERTLASKQAAASTNDPPVAPVVRRGGKVLDPFAGTSQAIRALAEDARLALASDSPVFIYGPTGSGKGVLARYLHEQGTRRRGRFVALNCGGLSTELLQSELFGHTRGSFTGAVRDKQGLFELAEGGTLFLDEIGDLDLQVQPKLLTVLEDKVFRRVGGLRLRTVDARFIAASHQDLARLVHEGRFRSDLYYRISTLVLHVPPLKARLEDIPALVDSILARCAVDRGMTAPSVSPDAITLLQAHEWPGNIRELRNVLERALVASDAGTIRPEHLRIAPSTPPATDLADDATLQQVERLHIERMLHLERGHVTRTARRLGIPRSTFYEKLKALGVNPDDYRS